ncbi:MAG TPA: hypothetical protein VLD55_13535 [Candidatus Sulfobium mesophilum]|nr:hypothetical protein [Candidatus Sulfobium mesophilum]
MKKALVFTFLMVAAGLAPAGQAASGCNVCHSKNPRMVRMHEELGFKDCFKCHGQGLQKTPEGRKAQMLGDGRCISCHNK